MTKFDELKKRFPNLIPIQELRANISIIELALHYSYEIQWHKGKNRPVLEHPDYQDTIIIKNPQHASQQIYQRAGDFADSGTLIDFVKNRLPTVFSRFNNPSEHELRNVTSVLYDYLRIDSNSVSQNHQITAKPAEPNVKQAFSKEQLDIRTLEPGNFLTKRSITLQTIDRAEFKGKVVAQVAYFNPETGRTDSFLTAKKHPERKYVQFTNVAFPYYNGQSSDITGMELRNENIKLHAPGSDRYTSVFVSNAPPKSLNFYVMESAIDALSHRQLRSIQGNDEFDSVYFSTGGQLTDQQVNTVARYIDSFDKEPNWKISLAFDNDINGCRFDLQFVQQLIAVKFPLGPVTGNSDRASYLLPDNELYQPIQKILLERINAYNQNVQFQLTQMNPPATSSEQLNKRPIIVSYFDDLTVINVPKSCSALTAFSQSLLEATGLAQRVVILKSSGKDFNEDLSARVKQQGSFVTTSERV